MNTIVAPPCVIDIEASGFGAGSYPIEVGYVLPDGRAGCSLICPLAEWTHWDPAAEKVHGIARELLLRHGKPPLEVAQMLNEALAGRTVYSDAWGHDFPWLARLFEAADLPLRFHLEPVAMLLDEQRLERLADGQRDARDELGLTRHRASNDARALQHALVRLGS